MPHTLHLLHENIGWTVIAVLAKSAVNSMISALFTLGTVLGLSAAITRFFERPAMRWIRVKWQRRTDDGFQLH